MKDLSSKEWYTFKKELSDNIKTTINNNNSNIDKDILETMLSMLNNTRIKK